MRFIEKIAPIIFQKLWRIHLLFNNVVFLLCKLWNIITGVVLLLSLQVSACFSFTAGDVSVM